MADMIDALSLDIGGDNPNDCCIRLVKSAISDTMHDRLEISVYSILTSVVHLPPQKLDF